MHDIKALIDLFCTPPAPHSGPRIYPQSDVQSGYRCFNAQRESVASIVQDIGVFLGTHTGTIMLDVWARDSQNARRFAPLIDACVSRDTPAPVEPSGRILHGDWVTFLWALTGRVEIKDLDRYEDLRRRLACLGQKRQPISEGFLCPGTVYGTSETTRTQETQYSYGPVRVPLTGQVEHRAVLVHFDPERRVSMDLLESLAPQVSAPRTLTGAISR